MKTTIRLALILALAALLSDRVPARADDAAVIRQRLKAASAAVHSVVIEMEMSPPGAAMPNAPRSINILVTVASPARAKSIAVVGPMHFESYQIDGMLYMHVQPGDSWRKISYDPAHPPAQVLDIVRAAKNERISVLPDSQEDGLTVGVIQVEVPLPAPAGTANVGPPVALTCSYDKATYRIRACANPTMSMTFTKYDDPSNTVELPAGAAGAMLIVPATPVPDGPAPPAAPSALPSPAPSATP